MSMPLPPKIFHVLTPAIKGYKGVAREQRFEPFINVLKSYFDCTVDERKNNMFKVSPPPVPHDIWCWKRVPFFIHKPVNGTLGRADLYRLQKTFKSLYGWDGHTFVRGRD